MKLFEVLYDCEECLVEDTVRRPSEDEHNLAVATLRRFDPTLEMGSIGVDELTGDINIETLSGHEFILRRDTGELENITKPWRVTEAAIRQFKRVGQEIRRRYRCMSGPKAGKLVATPGACATRKDPKKVRHGRRVMRSKKGVIARKTRVAKRKQLSKMVAKMNKRLAGKRVR